ncbi:hypothetical protein ALP8811_00839 [Aliiroseovarius pelagivivens]|uniref:Lipoprotein n=1 Tax=Aliiroseovarius pelagivivens TaxID=1639690 RepID=A0A2R8AIH2_9RHOB|nr:hypothetical protein [Aliiroseovarius pelagivivens]SPF75845.1 hypothetical protein ALP8811_00839 [Aliiroseovarius pelagivivens]
MVNNNKILTVSYGTFSCTLEGFDDPFGAMKSIAEYFRGLAEHDRSFGAEPVTPDAAMLHRIAERESLKQVDAEIEDQGIILRQSGEDLKAKAANAPEMGADAPTKPGGLSTKLAPEDIQTDDREEEAGAAHDLNEDDALSKLSRLRAAAMDDQQISDEFLEDEHAAGSAKSAVTDLDDLDEFEELISNHALAADTEATEESVSETADRVAKRQRVKDQIAMNDDGAPNVGEPLSASNLREDRAPTPPTVLTGAALAASAAEDESNTDNAIDETAQVSRVLRVKRKRSDDGQENVVVSQTNTLGSDSIEDAAEIEIDAHQDAAQEEMPVLTAEEEADLAAELALVEAESRAELDAQAQPEPVTEREFAAVAPMPPLPLDDSLRVAVQEVSTKVVADIAGKQLENAHQSELHHEIEALLSTMEAESRMDARRERRAQVFDEQEAARDDTALERILAETNTQMDDQGASRRRNSISHLKAAVQATRADKSSGSAEFEEEGQETPYRSDLAQAVKQPSPEATSTKSPEPHRASPLVLISEQRVNETEAEQDPSASASRDRFVRPRRVNVSTTRKRPDATDADPDAEPANADNPELIAFTAFASDVDQNDTAGYLRAAASFVTQSSGQSHFSRPQVVKLVTKMNVPGGISREDALRAFGRLLREGDIIKVAQGCYSLTNVTTNVDQGGLQTA